MEKCFGFYLNKILINFKIQIKFFETILFENFENFFFASDL